MRSLRLIATLLGLFLLAACGAQESPAPPPAPSEQQRPPAAGTGGCQRVQAPAPREDADRKAPEEALDEDATYTATVRTNCGDFAFELDTEAAPKAAASFAALARDGYFKDTVFHRIVPGFVIQGGDPTATGSGGPGYKTKDRPPSDATYGKGVVAMAKAEDEDPGTSGSQFYVVTADDAGLPPEYAVLGKVTSGMDVVERIGMLGDASEQPTQPVVVESVEIAES
ncbi:MAG: peptidylprolyl isomerase [Thermoleophilaceae bacterium]